MKDKENYPWGQLVVAAAADGGMVASCFQLCINVLVSNSGRWGRENSGNIRDWVGMIKAKIIRIEEWGFLEEEKKRMRKKKGGGNLQKETKKSN